VAGTDCQTSETSPVGYPVFVNTNWRKSSRSTHASNCVEVADLPGNTVGIRDSKDSGPGHPMLTFSHAEWNCFLAGVRAGDFELP
jgi:Domain of unknown function (DUF397)